MEPDRGLEPTLQLWTENVDYEAATLPSEPSQLGIVLTVNKQVTLKPCTKKEGGAHERSPKNTKQIS